MKKVLAICIYFFGNFSLQAQNLCGLWKSYEYPCFGVEPFESFAISHAGSYVVCTKIVGDNCVTSGQISWEGNYTSPVFPVMAHTGSPSQPNCCWDVYQVEVINDYHIVIANNINIWRLSCHEVDSLNYKYNDYGLNCDCHADPGTLTLYPSPFQNMVFVFNNSREEIKSVQILNTLGQIIFKSDIKVQEIELSNIARGIYLYYIETENGKRFRGKIMKL